MIDTELRRTFDAHERLTPDAAAVAARIAVGIVRRRRRVLVARLSAVVVAVLILGAGIPVVLWQAGTRPILPEATTSPAPSITGPVDGLVPAPPVEIVIPLSPGWLPDEVRTPTYTYTNANLAEGLRTLTYEAQPAVSGVESVSVSTRPQASPIAGDSDEGFPSWVSTHDERVIEVRGQQAHETVTTSISVGERTCSMTWTEPSGLIVLAIVTERTTSTETTCEIGERFARELRAEPVELARTVSLGLVPQGYHLVQTGTNGDLWCPTFGQSPGCIEIQDGQNYYAAENSTPITVRGHQGYLSRSPDGAVLLVPGFVRLSYGLGVPASVDTSDAGLVRLAESALLDRAGW
jgi:hypothetical protein